MPPSLASNTSTSSVFKTAAFLSPLISIGAVAPHPAEVFHRQLLPGWEISSSTSFDFGFQRGLSELNNTIATVSVATHPAISDEELMDKVVAVSDRLLREMEGTPIEISRAIDKELLNLL